MSNTKGVVAFLIFAFGLAWVSWEIPIRMGVPINAPLFQPFALLSAFAPAIAAVLVRSFVTREGYGDAGLRLRLRSWPWYLFGLALPLVVTAAIVLEASWLSVAAPDFTIPAVAKLLSANHVPVPPPLQLNLILIGPLLLAAVIGTPVLWGEEFGWRGYLQPRLFPSRPLLSAAITGLIWGVWHYPLILRGYDYDDQILAGATVFLGSTTLFSFIFAWLVQRTGSIWSSSLAHAATNAIGGGLTTLWFGAAHNPVVTSYAGLLAWPPLVLVCLVLMAITKARKVKDDPVKARPRADRRYAESS